MINIRFENVKKYESGEELGAPGSYFIWVNVGITCPLIQANKFSATHLSRDILKAFYVDNELLTPKILAVKTLDFKGCPALSG